MEFGCVCFSDTKVLTILKGEKDMSKASVVLGCFYGDEGKGRTTDYLAQFADVSVAVFASRIFTRIISGKSSDIRSRLKMNCLR